MGQLRERIGGLRGVAAADRATLVGLGVSALWLVMVLLFWWLGPEGSAQSGAARLVTLAGVLLPLALIWLAVGTARALAGLRDEAHALRAELLRMRGSRPARLEE